MNLAKTILLISLWIFLGKAQLGAQTNVNLDSKGTVIVKKLGGTTAASGTAITAAYACGGTVAYLPSSAFDGTTSSVVVLAESYGSWIGLDFGFGNAAVLSEVDYYPDPNPYHDLAANMLNGVFQGADTPDFQNPVTLGKITTKPITGKNVLTVSNTNGFRYLRYYPDPTKATSCSVADLNFIGHLNSQIKLTGTVLTNGLNGSGVAVEGANITLDYAGWMQAKWLPKSAFDGNPQTVVCLATSSGGWIGLDLGANTASITKVRYYPDPNFPNRVVNGWFQGSNSRDFANYVNLCQVTGNPAIRWNEIDLASPSLPVRYVRFFPDPTIENRCSLAELEFYGTLQDVPPPPTPSVTLPATLTGHQACTLQVSNAAQGTYTFYLDGIVIGPASGSSSVTLPDPVQGTHTLVTVYTDSTGNNIQSSQRFTVTDSTGLSYDVKSATINYGNDPIQIKLGPSTNSSGDPLKYTLSALSSNIGALSGSSTVATWQTSPNTPLAQGYLKAVGGDVLDQTGATVYLRGVNLSNWFNLEGWRDPTLGTSGGWGDVYGVMDQRFGPDADSILSNYQRNWVVAGDLDKIQGMGLNMVRIQMGYRNLMNRDLTWKMVNGQIDFGLFDWVVREAGKRNIYVVFSFQSFSQPSTYNPWLPTEPTAPGEDCRHTMVQVWSALAAHFRGNPYIAGFDLINEPSGNGDSLVVVDQSYQAVRAADPNRMCILEWGFDFNEMNQPGSRWQNVMWSSHYPVPNDSNLSASDLVASYLKSLAGCNYNPSHPQAPIFLGEINPIRPSTAQGQQAYVKALINANLHWAVWQYKSFDGNSFFRYDTALKTDYRNDTRTVMANKWTNLFPAWITSSSSDSFNWNSDWVTGFGLPNAPLNSNNFAVFTPKAGARAGASFTAVANDGRVSGSTGSFSLNSLYASNLPVYTVPPLSSVSGILNNLVANWTALFGSTSTPFSVNAMELNLTNTGLSASLLASLQQIDNSTVLKSFLSTGGTNFTGALPTNVQTFSSHFATAATLYAANTQPGKDLLAAQLSLVNALYQEIKLATDLNNTGALSLLEAAFSDVGLSAELRNATQALWNGVIVGSGNVSYPFNQEFLTKLIASYNLAASNAASTRNQLISQVGKNMLVDAQNSRGVDIFPFSDQGFRKSTAAAYVLANFGNIDTNNDQRISGYELLAYGMKVGTNIVRRYHLGDLLLSFYNGLNDSKAPSDFVWQVNNMIVWGETTGHSFINPAVTQRIAQDQYHLTGSNGIGADPTLILPITTLDVLQSNWSLLCDQNGNLTPTSINNYTSQKSAGTTNGFHNSQLLYAIQVFLNSSTLQAHVSSKGSNGSLTWSKPEFAAAEQELCDCYKNFVNATVTANQWNPILLCGSFYPFLSKAGVSGALDRDALLLVAVDPGVPREVRNAAQLLGSSTNTYNCLLACNANQTTTVIQSAAFASYDYLEPVALGEFLSFNWGLLFGSGTATVSQSTPAGLVAANGGIAPVTWIYLLNSTGSVINRNALANNTASISPSTLAAYTTQMVYAYWGTFAASNWLASGAINLVAYEQNVIQDFVWYLSMGLNGNIPDFISSAILAGDASQWYVPSMLQALCQWGSQTANPNQTLSFSNCNNVYMPLGFNNNYNFANLIYQYLPRGTSTSVDNFVVEIDRWQMTLDPSLEARLVNTEGNSFACASVLYDHFPNLCGWSAVGPCQTLSLSDLQLIAQGKPSASAVHDYQSYGGHGSGGSYPAGPGALVSNAAKFVVNNPAAFLAISSNGFVNQGSASSPGSPSVVVLK